MAIYHFSVQVIGRAQGRGAVAAVAYRAGERLHDERLDRDHDFRAKSGVEHSEILLPEGAPEQWRDRERLWNDVEAFEKRKDAQLGFDAVVGNPPWDQIKLQQVEWFAARRPEIARAQRASDRTQMIAKLKADGDPLHTDFLHVDARAADTLRIARASGHYPLLSRGDINLYSLFVERAMLW